MADPSGLRLEHFTSSRVDNPNPKGETPLHVYHKVRNAIVKCCRRHGPTGPMGIVPIDSTRKYPQFDRWERGDEDPWYFLVDDQPNDERYLYCELIVAKAITANWIADVTDALGRFPGWGIVINGIPECCLIVFESKLMVTGPLVTNCWTVPEVIEACTKRLREQASDSS